jgi:hypothetical protein
MAPRSEWVGVENGEGMGTARRFPRFAHSTDELPGFEPSYVATGVIEGVLR